MTHEYTAMRMIKKSRVNIVSNKIARSLVSGIILSNPKSFWDDVKKIKGNSSVIPKSVDYSQRAIEISELFADKYRKTV